LGRHRAGAWGRRQTHRRPSPPQAPQTPPGPARKGHPLRHAQPSRAPEQSCARLPSRRGRPIHDSPRATDKRARTFAGTAGAFSASKESGKGLYLQHPRHPVTACVQILILLEKLSFKKKKETNLFVSTGARVKLTLLKSGKKRHRNDPSSLYNNFT